MRAIIITHPGGSNALELRDVPAPEPGPEDILVRVAASALNRADLLQAEGRYPAPPGWPADIPGLEFAGAVERCGERVRLWKPGARVFGLVGGGAHAEFTTIHERAVAEIPANLNFSQAAAVPEAFITAHDALMTQAKLRPGERVLIPAAGSGVGLAAAQLIKAIGATAFGLTRSASKCHRAREFGYTEVGVVRDPLAELPGLLRRWMPQTDSQPSQQINVVLDLAGGPYTLAALNAMAPKGRLMLVGTVAGNRFEFPTSVVMSKRITVRGTVMRARPLEERIAAIQAFAREVVPLLASGTLRPTIDSEFPLAEIRQAHERLASNQTFGKVVLRGYEARDE